MSRTSEIGKVWPKKILTPCFHTFRIPGYFQHVKCMNRAGEEIHGCVKTFQKHLYMTAVKAPRKLKIAYACCGYHDFVYCCERALDERCGDPEAVDLMHETAENVFGSILSLTCGSYQRDSSDCRSLDVLPQAAANETVRRNFISPLKAIVRSLG
ncbi:hypothetical protein HPB48_005053 [Haemaphysalis longicornis]|uniref:Uncharacterized protein n=1 Tax=Haemaphysalis longicornis TaxID=44386 RepID=A0A9J6GAZ8_HAELO|nr:hypothetical protein HPB48_005053 [Haemaphysalis longicornis]